MGAPIIHSVDPAIFTLRYFARCLACGFCNDQCCEHGVDIDSDNARRLLALDGEFRERVAAPPSQWFTSQDMSDSEFPSGVRIRTQVQKGRCVFVSKSGRGCAIHAYCIEKNLDYHTLKPIVSALFPVTFERGVLEPSVEASDGSLVCNGHSTTLYEGARGELNYYFGPEFVDALDALELATRQVTPTPRVTTIPDPGDARERR